MQAPEHHDMYLHSVLPQCTQIRYVRGMEKPQASNRIAELRKEAGLSQERLAGMLNSGRSTVVKLERGEMALSQDWMERIARAIGCEPWELLPNSPRLTEEDRAMLARFHALPPEKRKAFLEVLPEPQPPRTQEG